MRAVIQRVSRACVRINNEEFSSISEGIIVLLGVEKEDTKSDADYLLEKTLNLRIFEDDQDKMNLSLLDISGEMMVVSQFTLLGNCTKGRRPSFVQAEERRNFVHSVAEGSIAGQCYGLRVLQNLHGMCERH